jgi:glycosyltransferase involved in cell wall biosynthesis
MRNLEETKISIITVCLNASETIEKTILSVLGQSYKNIEYIVIDGKSSDGTVDIIKKYESKIAYFVSEQDKGIYDAMNKSMKFVTGEVIYFLNADDTLHDENVISDIVIEFAANPDADIIYGKIIPTCVPENLLHYIKEYRIIKSKYDLLDYGLCHQCMFIRRSLFDRVGCFDLRYKIRADYDWLLSACDRDAKLLFTNRFIAYYYYKGFSYTESNKYGDEKESIIYRHYPLHIYVFYLTRYVFLRSLKAKTTNAIRRIFASLMS